MAKATAKSAKTTKTATASPAPNMVAEGSGLGWIDAGKGYQLALENGKLVARKDKGKRLSSGSK